MPDAKTLVILAGLGLLLVGAKTVGHGVKVGAVKTEHGISHVVHHVFRHPVHAVKEGAISKEKK